jgi:hypothetical protein
VLAGQEKRLEALSPPAVETALRGYLAGL